MTVRESARILREQWVVVALAVLASVLVATLAWLVRPAEYTSQLTLYVSTQADSTTAAYQGAQLSQQRVVSYVELVGSPRVGGEVAARLGLPATADQVAERITATNPLDSVLVEVAVTGTTPQDAALVAETVGAVVGDLVDEIEAPAVVAGAAPVTVQVVQPATLPAQASSIGWGTAVALGLLVGLALGIAVVLARRAVDASITSAQQLREVTGAPTLATVALDTAAPAAPLPVAQHARSPRAAAFHRLRATLQFLDPADPPRVVLVASAVPGEGRSSTVVGLAAAQAAAGSRVLVVDADLRTPALARILGVDDAIGLTDVLAGRAEPEQAVQRVPGGFDVVPSGSLPADPTELLSPLPLRATFAQLRMHYDVILVDAPALLPVTDAMVLAACADGVLLACRRGRTTRAQVAEAVEVLGAVSARVLGGVLTVPARGPRPASGVARRSAFAGPALDTPTAPAPSTQKSERGR